jgi:hypothetical protein
MSAGRQGKVGQLHRVEKFHAGKFVLKDLAGRHNIKIVLVTADAGHAHLGVEGRGRGLRFVFLSGENDYVYTEGQHQGY